MPTVSTTIEARLAATVTRGERDEARRDAWRILHLIRSPVPAPRPGPIRPRQPLVT